MQRASRGLVVSVFIFIILINFILRPTSIIPSDKTYLLNIRPWFPSFSSSPNARVRARHRRHWPISLREHLPHEAPPPYSARTGAAKTLRGRVPRHRRQRSCRAVAGPGGKRSRSKDGARASSDFGSASRRSSSGVSISTHTGVGGVVRQLRSA